MCVGLFPLLPLAVILTPKREKDLRTSLVLQTPFVKTL
jgi:hypothetical protein